MDDYQARRMIELLEDILRELKKQSSELDSIEGNTR